MKNCKSLLQNDPTDWLLESDNPSVRYFTLTDIIEKPENDFEVIDAKNQSWKQDLFLEFWKSKKKKVKDFRAEIQWTYAG